MSVAPSPFVSPDQLEAQPVPDLPDFIKGTDVKGTLVHIAVPHIVMIIPGPNYNTFAMTSGHNLQIVTFEEETP